MSTGADGWRARYYPGSQFFSYTFDPQGNVIQRQNGGNTSTAGYDTASYQAYGKRGADYTSGGTNPAPDQDPARFGGQWGYYTDTNSGLICLTHRYYDPGTGRFLNRDPIGYSGGINLYELAGGNPVNEKDPRGLDGPPNPFAAWDELAEKIDEYTRSVGEQQQTALRGFSNAMGFLGDFLTGQGPSTRYYAPNSTQSQQLLNSAVGKEILEQLTKQKYSRHAKGSVSTPAAAIDTAKDLFTNWTEFQVGAFTWKVKNHDQWDLTIEVYNVADINSFLYHLPGSANNYDRIAGPYPKGGIGPTQVPMSNIYQYFEISVPIPQMYISSH